MLYAGVLVLLLWIGYIMSALANIQKQNRQIIAMLEEIKTRTVNAEYHWK